jgi:UDP-N-acetylmuramoylalanine--D-glutamate ligase
MDSAVNFKGQTVVVVGAGRTGVEAAKLLALRGARVILSDSDCPDNRSHLERSLSEHEIELELGGHKEESFLGADLVILSPGVPPYIEPVRAAEKAGVPVMSEMEFASPFCDSRIVAVTGTNGKTTTTTLIHRMVKEAGTTALLAGNNEFPLSSAVMAKPAPDVVVLEVSSFQLERVETFCPEIAVVLNVTPDHLERYSGLDDYRNTKMRLFDRQGPSCTAVLNGDDAQMCADASGIRARKLFFSVGREVATGVFVSNGDIVASLGTDRKPLARVDDVTLAGRHNLANALAALCVCIALDVPESAMKTALRSFRGLEHRMEFVARKGGVTFINDSKATNLAALEKALVSMDTPVILIAGGRGKGSDYSAVRPLIRDRVKALVLIGEDAPLIEAALGGLAPVSRAKSMDKAVQQAYAAASDGDSVLLSPACSSFDMFRDFEERGERFKAAVSELKE